MMVLRRIEGAVVAYCAIERLLADEPASIWLSADEYAELSAMRHEPARRQRLAGRILAKMLVLRQFEPETGATSCHPQQVRINSRDGLGRRVAPRVSIDGRWLNWSLTVSHTESIVAAALSTDGTRPVGIDVTDLAAGTNAALLLWLTSAEQEVAADRGIDGTVHLWCLKEAAFKALAGGRDFRPLQWDVSGCVPRIAESAAREYRGRGVRGRTSESVDVVTSAHCHASIGDVRMRTAGGWMSRSVDVHAWEVENALICIARARTNAWAEMTMDDPPAETVPTETPRLRLSELSGCRQ
ncbi:MAG: 4'-phosphopantetheinyl transferase family protein [Maioricimonas sp. JB049]